MEHDSGIPADKRRGKPEIRHDKGVRAEREQTAGKLDRTREFPAVELRVEDNMRFHAEKPTISDRLADRLLRKIFRGFTRVEALRTELHRIRTGRDGRAQRLRRTGGSQQLRLHFFFSSSMSSFRR